MHCDEKILVKAEQRKMMSSKEEEMRRAVAEERGLREQLLIQVGATQQETLFI
jgi:hypothetical protein